MPKMATRLGDLAVRALGLGTHAVGDPPGLCLSVSSPNARSWVLRVMVEGKRQEIGLGPYPEVSLIQAREEAAKTRAMIRAGRNPLEEQAAKRSQRQLAEAAALTFRECAEKYIEEQRAGWKSAKHGAQWTATLEQYAHPFMGDVLARQVDKAVVLRVLEQPIKGTGKTTKRFWEATTETATRVRGRIESILDWAKGRGYREGDNPAAWKGNLDAVLPAPAKVAKETHHPALAVREAGAFMAELRKAPGMGARVLEFTILTAVRSGEARGARWGEIDWHERAWNVPGVRMKGKRDHRVPLSDAAVALLQSLPKGEAADLIFPAPRAAVGAKPAPMSDMTLLGVIRRMNRGKEPRWVDESGRPVVPHGFRSTFRDWAGERTNHPHEVCEMALAHAVRNQVEAAYRRGDLFEKRRRLMAEWADFLARVETRGNVVPFEARRTAS